MTRPKPRWQRLKFGDVVRLVTDRCDPVAEGIERFVGLEHIEPGDLRIRAWGEVADGTTFTNRFRPGQVLFGKRRAYQRKVAVADFDGVCSGDIYILETAIPKRLLPELVPYLCQTDKFFEHAVGTSAGSLSPRTNWRSLAQYDLSLPPITEQDRLVRVLRAFSSSCNAATEAGHRATLTRRALLFEWFRPNRGPRDSFPAHWKIVTVRSAGDTQVGIRKHPGSLAGPNMQPYLRVANVLDGFIDWSDIMHINVPDADRSRCALQNGDVLLNKGNSMNLVGRSAVYQTPAKGGACYFQDHLLRFRAGPDVESGFAQAYFQHLFYTLQFTKIAVASTSIATIHTDRFEQMPFPIPPLAEQKDVVERLALLDAAIDSFAKRAQLAGLARAAFMREHLERAA